MDNQSDDKYKKLLQQKFDESISRAGIAAETYEQANLPKNVRNCLEYHLPSHTISELLDKWGYMTMLDPQNINYAHNFKLLNFVVVEKIPVPTN